MTIYEIKQRTKEDNPYFFDRKTLRFFGQTLKSFSVVKVGENLYRISAPMLYNGTKAGTTVRIFNASTNELKTEGNV